MYMPEYICPHCGNPIGDDEALLCLYCGESLERPVGFLGKLKYPTPKILFAGIVALLIVSFFLWVIL